MALYDTGMKSLETPGKNLRTRLSLITASILASFGVLRFASDMLTDGSPGWHSMLGETIFRYLARAPSDGTLLGDLSVQYVKLLSIPCAIAGFFILYRLIYSDRREADIRWHKHSTRMIYIGILLAAFTVMEIEKATHAMGLRMAGLLAGEKTWLNHTLHIASALAGWFYMKWLVFIPRKDN
ncbi:MAG: hypothetical protein HY811_00440 [Planctomycetes bacterium]|nr:hypothetical protein [Planctomycetota bacterium]